MKIPRCLVPSLLLVLPAVTHAQSLAIDLGAAGQAGATGRLVQITALVTVLSLAPSLLVMVTAFTRIVIVLSLLRSALATQGTPPNIVLIGLALFLTFFVMQPVLDESWTTGLLPLTEGRVGELEGLRLATEPFRHFMTANMRPADLQLFLDIGHLQAPAATDDAPWHAMVPAFLVGELRRAFEMGFLLFLPFMVIDMVVASVLMSLAWDDDAAAERGFPAVQADLLRHGRRLAPGVRQLGAELQQPVTDNGEVGPTPP
jgi:flagellar biosynthesis protein FliP